MAQLHFYIPDELAEKIKMKADHAHLSVSKYLARIVKSEVNTEWPEDYFDHFGEWQGSTLQRPAQEAFEQRETLD